LKIPYLFTYQTEAPKELKNLIKTLLQMPIDQVFNIKKEQKIYVKREYDLNEWAEKIKLCYSKDN
jgi:hypothetical protein